jgi:hypothetical protein
MITADLVKLDHQGAPWSDREIARRCKVDGKTVVRLRRNSLENGLNVFRIGARCTRK